MLSFLFPAVCPLCQTELLDKNEKVCKACAKKDIFLHEPTCYSCGKPLDHAEKEYCADCRKRPKNWVRNIGLCTYEEPVKSSLLSIKYHNKREYIQYYLYETERRKGKWLKQIHPDLVIPVPMYWRKQRKRGFNQAEVLAKGIAKMIGCPSSHKIICRVHDTKPLKTMDPGQRKKNLSHAFIGDSEAYRKAGSPKRVLIVDDIYTTGATMQGVSGALSNLGVKEIYGYCIAVGKGFS